MWRPDANRNTLGGHTDGIRALAVINSGTVLVSADGTAEGSCTIRYWDMKSGERLAVEPNTCATASFSFSPDDTLLAVAEKSIAIMKREARKKP